MAKAAQITLGVLAGRHVEEIHTAYGDDHDQVTLVLDDHHTLRIPVDLMVPIGEVEWDDYWTDFDDFVAEGPDDLEPEGVEGSVITLAELIGRRIEKVRTGVGSAKSRFVMLDLDDNLSLLMPAESARLGTQKLSDSTDFEALLDDEVNRCVHEEQTI